MEVFEQYESTKTRSRMRRGQIFGHKPTEATKNAFLSGGEVTPPWTEEMEHSNLILDWGDIVGEVLLPGQQGRPTHLSPEQTLCDQLLFETLEELKVTFQEGRKVFKKVTALKKNQEDILAWVDGEPAPLTFEYVTTMLGIDEELARVWIVKACQSWLVSNGTKPELDLLRRTVYTPEALKEEIVKPDPEFTERCLEFEKFARRFATGTREDTILARWKRQKEVIQQRSVRCPHNGGLKSLCKRCRAKTDQVYHKRIRDQANAKRKAEGKTIRFDPCPHGKLKFSNDAAKRCHPCYLAEERIRQGKRRAEKRVKADRQPRYIKCLHNHWHSKCLQCKQALKIALPFESHNVVQEAIGL